MDLATGHKQFWKQLLPPDLSGVTEITQILITPDGRSYVYEYARTLSDLYLVKDVSKFPSPIPDCIKQLLGTVTGSVKFG
jgi:hypothetical protein